MPRYKFAFPINHAVFADENLSFHVADVLFVKKSDLSKEFYFINEDKLQLGENHIFGVVTVCGNEPYAKDLAYDKCCFDKGKLLSPTIMIFTAMAEVLWSLP